MSRKKSPPENPVTPDDEELFDGMFRRWLDQLNLSDWRVVKLKKRSTSMAEVTDQDTVNRIVRYKIGSDFGLHPVNLETLESTAIHEALHVRFHEMIEAAYEDGEYTERVAAAEHSTIVVLTPLLHELARLKRLLAKAESES